MRFLIWQGTEGEPGQGEKLKSKMIFMYNGYYGNLQIYFDQYGMLKINKDIEKRNPLLYIINM